MDRQRILFLAGALVLVGLMVLIAGFVLWPGPTPAEPIPPPQDPVARAEPSAGQQAPPDAIPEAGSEPSEALAHRTPHEEALFAAIAQSGEGFVRCVLPADAPKIKLDGLNWAGQQGRVLTMAVEGTAGVVPLRDHVVTDVLDLMKQAPDEVREVDLEALTKGYEPILYARWSRDPDVLEGRCEILSPDDRVTVTVEVREADGTPVQAGVLWPGGAAQTDGSGRAEARLIPGVRTTVQGRATTWEDPNEMLEAFAAGEGLAMRTGSREILPAAGETYRIELREDQTGSATFSTDTLDEVDDFAEDSARMLDAALQTPGLSPGAIAQLEAWKLRVVQAQNTAYEASDSMDEAREQLKEVLDDPALREVLERAQTLE